MQLHTSKAAAPLTGLTYNCISSLQDSHTLEHTYGQRSGRQLLHLQWRAVSKGPRWRRTSPFWLLFRCTGTAGSSPLPASWPDERSLLHCLPAGLGSVDCAAAMCAWTPSGASAWPAAAPPTHPPLDTYDPMLRNLIQGLLKSAGSASPRALLLRT